MPTFQGFSFPKYVIDLGTILEGIFEEKKKRKPKLNEIDYTKIISLVICFQFCLNTKKLHVIK